MTSPARHQANAATRKALDQRFYTLFGRAVKEVRITRVHWPEGRKWVAMVIGTHGREVPVHGTGLHTQAALVLKDAFPRADWDRAQDYDATTGTLSEHIARMPTPRGGDVR
ncbi:hypothetical protein [Streptomyces sp. NPDC055058]